MRERDEAGVLLERRRMRRAKERVAEESGTSAARAASNNKCEGHLAAKSGGYPPGIRRRKIGNKMNAFRNKKTRPTGSIPVGFNGN